MRISNAVADGFGSVIVLALRLAREINGVRSFADPATTARYVIEALRHSPEIIRQRNLAPADRAMAQRRFRARIFGAEIILPGSLFPIAREMYGRKAYFGLPSLRVHPGDSVVDLGANVGAFTLLAAKLGARVLAVEAQAGFIPLLRDLVKQNGCGEKVFVEQALVGGHGMLGEPGGLDVASHHNPDRPPRHFRIAELLDRHSFDRIEFLKIDIEGSEFDLLTRDNDWLRRVQKMTMEVHTLFGNPGMLVAELGRFGFRSVLFSADARPVQRISGEGGYLCAVRESDISRIAVPGRGQEGDENCPF